MTVLAVLFLINLAATLVLVGLYLSWWRRFARLTRGTKGEDLEHLLIEHMKSLDATAADITKTKAAYDYLEGMAVGSVQKIGLVRFNPFPEVGSDQSFALALLDRYNSGVVLSSIHGREGTRIYAKAVEGGRSPHQLSGEEETAIRRAETARNGKIDDSKTKGVRRGKAT